MLKKYRLTDEEYDELIAAYTSSRYLVAGGMEPLPMRERIIRVWAKVASRVNCKLDTIADDGDDPKNFVGEPNGE